MALKTHRNLAVWSRAVDLCVAVYKATGSLPPAERYGLTSQTRRAAVSVASNIAEGAGRGSSRDFIRFLHIARGSLAELETQLELTRRCGFGLDLEEVDQLAQSVGQLLNGLIRALAHRQQ